MSSHKNHRRDHDAIQDNGPTWEGGPPCSGCNSTHVARTRTKWRVRGRRAERRTGKRGANNVFYSTGSRQKMPPIEEE